MNFNKEKCRILHLKKNDLMHNYMLRNVQLESNIPENKVGVLVEPEMFPRSKGSKWDLML